VTAAVELREVHKRYRVYRERYRSLKEFVMHRRLGDWEDHWVLRGVSLDVEAGSILGLIGPNGAGKSTTLKLMAGILVPDSGSVHVSGSLSALIELGAGFQQEYTGRENVYLNAALLGLPRREIDRRFDDIVAFSGLEKDIDAPVRTYSSGMYMRLGFSVAIHVDPQIMLVDEILAVGDESFQRKCFDWLDRFHERGGTIVLISHNLSAVRELCSQVAWIEDGGVEAIGDPSTIINAYLKRVHEQDRQVAGLKQSRPAIELGSVRILGGDGRPVETIATGDPITFAIPYRVHQPVEGAVFGIAIRRSDGAFLYGTNTGVDRIPVPLANGEGTALLRFPSMPGLAGTYSLTVGVFDSPKLSATPIDFQDRQYSFHVVSSTGEEGIARIPHEWVFDDCESGDGIRFA
jgi:ABC-2 type transport system ATP-binding protein